jgi:hypothetical protein
VEEDKKKLWIITVLDNKTLFSHYYGDILLLLYSLFVLEATNKTRKATSLLLLLQ